MSQFCRVLTIAFLLANNSDAFSVNHRNIALLSSARTNGGNALKMASAEDEIAALRAKAAKAREEAQKLEKEMGKEITPTAVAEVKKEAPKLSSAEVKATVSAINFEAGDASAQVSEMSSLMDSDKLGLWGAAQTSSANTNSPSPLRPYPVSLNFLEQRTGGQITAESLGVGGGEDVSLDDFKYATLYVTGGSSIAGVAALVFLPENVGATICYFAALIPILFLAVGSTAPAAIAGAIAALRGSSDDKDAQEDRVCRHEAGHFLCGYLCGLPIKSYSSNDMGIPCVEFYPAMEGEIAREFTSEEIAALSVVAMSGSVAEALAFGEAKGGQNDLLQLDGLMRRSSDFVGAQKQQDLTRWGALAAYNIIISNKDKYERLVDAFVAKKSVAECIAAIEGSS